jgi:hypothetical protein
MHTYVRHACGMASVRSTSMRDAPMRWPAERHACEMATMRNMPMRDMPMRWPMEETRLGYGLWEMHAYERQA